MSHAGIDWNWSPGGHCGQPTDCWSDTSDDEGDVPASPPAGGERLRPLAVGRVQGGPQATDWCFTAHVKPSLGEGAMPAGIVYCIYQEEKSANGVNHWQGFLQLDKRVRMHQVQHLVGDPTCHVETRKGTANQAADYCRKSDTAIPGTLFEFGIIRGAKVNHMDDLKLAMDNGCTEWDLMQNHFSAWTRAERSCAKYIQSRDARIPRQWHEPRVELHWGATRTGKTRFVREWIANHADGLAYDKPSGPWWNGYTDQSVIFFDDYDGTIPIDTLLQLLDGYGYGMNLPTKGSVVTNKCRRFFFTSNKPLEAWYPNATGEQVEALKRRFTKIKEYRQQDVYVKMEREVIELE